MRWTRIFHGWGDFVRGAGHDVQMVTRTLQGDGPSPVLRSARRPPGATQVSPSAPRMAMLSDVAASILTALGARVRVVPGGVDAAIAASRARTMMTISLAGKTQEVSVARGQSLLAAAEGAGLAMPFSCRAGGCGACRVRLVAGEVALPATHCLSAAELEAGDVLACVGSPCGDVTIEVYS